MSDKSLIDVDLKPIADVTNNIIDKFAQAVGWLATPRGSRKDMEIAVETYIKEIQEDNSLPPTVKAAKISNVRKEIKDYVNLQDVIQHAQLFGKEYEPNGEKLDEDWAMFFYDRARNVSRHDAKVLWGKILAEECNKIGSIPKTLIHTLSVMSKQEAESFEGVCGFIVDTYNSRGYVEKILIIPPDYKSISEGSVTLDKIMNLEALGLLTSTDKLRIDFDDEVPPINKVVYYGSEILLRYESSFLYIGEVNLTNAGRVLSKIITGRKFIKYVDYLKSYFETNNVIVDIIQSNTLN